MAETDLDGMVRDNRRIWAQIELCANGVMARGDITAAQGYVLLRVLRHNGEGTSLTDIHRELGYSMAHLSATVKGLRKKGYVRMERCAGDDRRKLIYATDRGERLRSGLEEAASMVQRRLYGCFSQAELMELDRLQKKMMRSLSVHTDFPNDSRRHEDCEESLTTTQTI